MKRAVVPVLLMAALTATVPAQAALEPPAVITTTAGSRFAPHVVAIPRGMPLRLVQLDPTVRHDVVSRYVIRGRPMFATSRTLSFAETELVTGVEDLGPAIYPFTCSIHPEMFGELIVRG